MRPGQQKQRSRGRSSGSSGSNNNNNSSNNNNNNNQRKGQNPLTRTYDSSGPDVKIRGTAQHIAEKYMTLARDATSSGDRVMAENYLQHAEHYNRIIAAAQALFQERVQRDDRPDSGERQDFNERQDFSDRQDDNERDDEDNDGNERTDRNDRGNDRNDRGNERNERSNERSERGNERNERGGERNDRSEQPVQQAPQRQHRERPEPQPVVIDSSTPQPVFESTPAEVQIEQEMSAQENAEPTQPRRRSAPRPRRAPRQPKAEGVVDEAPAPVDVPAE